MTEGNDSERPEETVDRIEEEALRREAPGSKGLADRAKERDEDSAEPAFDQDKDVADLPGEHGGSASEPAD